MPQETSFITTPEASQVLHVSHRTVHRMVAAGELTPVRKLPGPNGAFLFDSGDVQRAADERRGAVAS